MIDIVANLALIDVEARNPPFIINIIRQEEFIMTIAAIVLLFIAYLLVVGLRAYYGSRAMSAIEASQNVKPDNHDAPTSNTRNAA